MSDKNKWILGKYIYGILAILSLFNYLRYRSIFWIILLVISVFFVLSYIYLLRNLNKEEARKSPIRKSHIEKKEVFQNYDNNFDDSVDENEEDYDDPEFDNYDEEKNYKANVARSLMGMFEENGNPQSNKSQAAFSFLALCANLTRNDSRDSEENIIKKTYVAKFGLEMFGFDFEGSEAEDYIVSGPELINGLIMIEHPRMGISERYMMLKFANDILRANGPISIQTKNTLEEILNTAFYSSEDIDLLLNEDDGEDFELDFDDEE